LSHSYKINEMFFSLQGEGVRAGTANVFVRFSGCNMECDMEAGPRSPGGFVCDTEFVSGRPWTAKDMAQRAHGMIEGAPIGEVGVIFTGGEPGLQLTEEVLEAFRAQGFGALCVETNGTIDLSPLRLDWISCSPKVAEHAMRLKAASELRYVVREGSGVPRPRIESLHYCLSPAFQPDGSIKHEDLAWAIRLCKENPQWRLSVQQHKQWRVR
jgi:organic radical activating enzyme